MERIAWLQKFELKFGSWNAGNFCVRDTKVCEQLRKRDVDMGDGEGKKLDLLVAEVGDVRCGGLKIMMELEGSKFGERRNLRKDRINPERKWQSDGNGAGF